MRTAEAAAAALSEPAAPDIARAGCTARCAAFATEANMVFNSACLPEKILQLSLQFAQDRELRHFRVGPPPAKAENLRPPGHEMQGFI